MIRRVYNVSKEDKRRLGTFYDQDMFQLGEAFRLAEEYNWDMPYFIESFMNREMRVAMDKWHPFLSNCSNIELLNIYVRDFGEPPQATEWYTGGAMEWIEMMYGYMIYQTSLSSKELYKELPFKAMLWNYRCGHQMSFSGYADKLCGLR